MKKRNRPLNWPIILSNIAEARQQLQDIEATVAANELQDEISLRLDLHHAYHHLNFAWNIRHKKAEQYAHLTQRQFKRWGKHPKRINRL